MPNIARTALLLVIAFGAVAIASTLADTFTEPSSAPPNGNIAAPVNEGSVTQAKVGGLTADGVIVDNQYQYNTSSYNWKLTSGKYTLSAQKFCLNGNCITTWPTGGAAGSCSLQRTTKVVDTNGQAYQTACETATPAGYYSAGSDSCTVSGPDNCDNGGRDALCFYVKVTCS